MLDTRYPLASLRGRRLKGKGKGALGKGVLGARETRGAREGGVRRGTPARKPLFSPSRLLIKLLIVDTTAAPVRYIVGQ